MSNPTTAPTETCAFCGLTVPTETAVEFGWAPNFYVGDESADKAACAICADHKLRYDTETMEWELIEDAKAQNWNYGRSL
jgi:hypothetical protein